MSLLDGFPRSAAAAHSRGYVSTVCLSVCMSPTWLLVYLLVVEDHLNYKDQGVWVDGSYSLADFFVYLVFVAL